MEVVQALQLRQKGGCVGTAQVAQSGNVSQCNHMSNGRSTTVKQMLQITITIIITFLCLTSAATADSPTTKATIAAQISSAVSGALISYGGGQAVIDRCVSDAEYDKLREIVHQSAVATAGSETPLTLFEDPVDSGMNSPGRPVNNYVDLDSGGGILDYNCGSASYDGHQGIDIEIRDFYDMDEGVPILCAAEGVVYFTHDGEFDRRLECIPGAVANAVAVEHADGSSAYYFHMRKNSVQVQVGDTVEVGDILGYIGSSGCSTFPHLHFEIHDGVVVEPHHGPCQGNPSRWAFPQGPYVMDLPLELLTHGVTTLNATWELISERPPSATHVQSGQTISTWIKVRSLQDTDSFTWKLYANGNLWNEFSFIPGNDYRISWWYTFWNLPISSSYYGNWEIRIYHNVTLIADQEFLYDANANQAPSVTPITIPVEVDSSVSGELVGADVDGEIFWYEVASGTSNGVFTQYGGRKRKFKYVPNSAFEGQDTVEVYAIDNDSLAGPTSFYIFDVVATGCCQNRGDADGSGSMNVADVTYLVAYLKGLGPEPPCEEEADVDGSASVNVADVTYLVAYLKGLGPAPPDCP
jgi:murein DD-endopeptidase MepM/ murein hydrolase activator NlpD